MNKSLKHDLIIAVIMLISVFCIIITIPFNPKKDIKNEDAAIQIDTVYNKIILDSIRYDIRNKDSIVIKLKKQITYEVKQAISANDSIAIEQFKQLASE
jgi:hypothetical protein